MIGKCIFTIFALIILISLLTGSGCANIIPPGGGPKDTLPPVLVSALPKDSILHFKGNKIVLTFNEYVQLDNNMNDNLIVSPFPVSVPTVAGKLRNVTILLKDSLKPNTTYSINFGRGLKDVNEGNIAKNFTYIFSTGDKLDQGKLTGNVVVAETGNIDTTLLVVLHDNLTDTSIKKNNPKYFTRLDGKGNFVFRNLAPGNYNVFVLPNEYSKKYDDSTKMFAFIKAPVKVTDSLSAPSVTLYAYRQFKATPKKKTNNNPNKKKPAKPAEKPKLKMTVGARGTPQDLLSPLTLSFSSKIDSFDTAKVVLMDTNFHRIKGYSLAPVDTLLTKFELKNAWPENTFYKLIVQADAFKDSNGTTLGKADTVNFKTKKETEYGSIRLHFNGLDLTKNPVLQLVQADKVIDSIPLTSKEWYQQLFTPGEYQIRILYDDNKNGTWDPGDYSLKKPPEIVVVIKSRKLIIKSNMDNEVDINM